MKILVIKFRNIGDVLLITPVIKNLKIAYPEAIIDVAINEETKEVLELNPNINRIFAYKRNYIKSLPLFKRLIEEVKFIRSIVKNRYDLVINLTEGDRGSFIALFSRAKKRVGFKVNFLGKIAFNIEMPKSQGFKHQIEWGLDAIRVLNKKIKTKRVEIYWSRDDEETIDKLNLPKKFIHIHPVSRWFFKCIDDKIMAKIIDFIQTDLKLPVVLTAAPIKAEIEKIEKIKSFCKTNPIDLSGKLTLKQTAALNKRAKFFIGVDTAIMHISAANDIPVIAFFGPSGAFNWGPWDNDLMESGYNKKNGFQKMGKHRVIQVNWDCAPCGKDGCNGSKISECLIKGLDFEFIKKNIEEVDESITY